MPCLETVEQVNRMRCLHIGAKQYEVIGNINYDP